MRTDARLSPSGRAAGPISAQKSVALNAINGLRGPGSLAIAIAHFGIATDFFVVQHLQPVALLVDLFFVLSGLLIAQVYGDKLHRVAAIPEYIVRRFGRIWPVQAATLAVLVAYEAAKFVAQLLAHRQFSTVPFGADGLNLPQAIPTNLLLIHSLGLHDRETWNFPSWSLSVEFITYSVFALFCLTSPAVRRSLAVLTVLASIAVLILVAPYHMRSTFDYGIFRCLAGFFAGALCYDALQRWSLPRWPLPTLVEFLAVALVAVWMTYCVGTYLAFAAPIVFCLLIAAFVPERGLISKLLKAKPLQWGAELSFTVYMVHAIVLMFLFSLAHQYERSTGVHLFITALNPLAGHPGAAPTIQVIHIDSLAAKLGLFCIYIALVLAGSYGLYRAVEVPGRAFFGGVAKRFARAGASRHGTCTAIDHGADPVTRRISNTKAGVR